MKKFLLLGFFFTLINIFYPISFSQKEYSIDELKSIVKENPDNPQLHNQLGLSYLKANLFKEAISEFETAFSLNPNNPDYINNLGIAYYLSNKLEEAIVFFNKAIQLDSSLTNTYLNLGIAYYKKGDTENAIKSFIKVTELSPQESIAYENLGEIYSTKSDWANAIKYYEKANEINPNQPVIMNNLSFAYLKSGNKIKALELMEQVSKLLPGNETIIKNLKVIKDSIAEESPQKEEEQQKQPEVSVSKPAQLREEKKPTEEERQSLESSSEIVLEDKPLEEEKFAGAFQETEKKVEETFEKEPPVEIKTENKKEYQLVSPDEMEKKIKRVEKKKEENKQEGKSSLEKKFENKINEGKYVLLSKSKINIEDSIIKEEKERRKKEKEEKRQKLNEEKIKNKAESIYKDSLKHLLSNNIPHAFKFINKAIELNPKEAKYYITLGIIELLSNNFEYAKENLEKALEIEPQNSKATYCYAYLHYKSNDFISAKEKLLPLITQTSTTFPNPHGLYGSIKLIENELDEAKKHLQEAINKGITDPAVFNNLSLIHLLEGDDERSLRLIKEALKFDYTNEVIQNNFNFITAKNNKGKENLIKEEISRINISEIKIFYLHDSDLIMNKLKINPINFYDHIKTRWKKKKIIILPFLQSSGYEKWEITPGERIANLLKQNMPKSKYFDIEFINDNYLTEIFYKSEDDFINEFIQYYDADIVITGRYIGFSNRIEVEKKMYGMKKINNTIVTLNTEVEIMDLQSKERIYSGNFISEAKLRKSRLIDLSVKTKINLENEALKEFGKNIYDFLINHFNLKDRARPLYLPPKIEEERIMESEKKYYRLRQFK